MLDPLELGRRGQVEQLRQAAIQERDSGEWRAISALQHACAWLLAGDPAQADLLVVEADLLEPSFGLIPDLWAFWPAPPLAEGRAAEASDAQAWMQRFQRWRRADPAALWHLLRSQLEADWVAALEPEVCGDDLLILGHLSAAPNGVTLEPRFEDVLVRLVDDGAIASHPASACRFWQLVASVRPGWDLARIRAADLCLSRGELEASSRWLSDPPATALSNPWFHDVTARQALQAGDLERSLDAWQEAIRCASAEESSHSLTEVFEQRRREARRGPGVLWVRSLFNRGESAEARRVLERLLADDPQWQPLRSLREQLVPPPTAPEPVPSVAEVEGDPGEEAIKQRLDRVANRLQALGIPVPVLDSPVGSDADVRDEDLESLDRRLTEYEARFALA